MNQIKNLERDAIDAFRRGIGWNEFWERHGNEIKQAEKWNRQRFRQLYRRLMHLVCSGDTNGMMPVGDDDPPWVQDDAQAPAPVSDTTTQARCLWPTMQEATHDRC